MDAALNLLSWALLITGSGFVLVGGIGLLRLPDFFARLHAASLTDTLGVILIVVGLALQSGWSQTSVKLGLIFLFVFITSPTATHALAKAAVHGGLRPLHGKGEEICDRILDQ